MKKSILAALAAVSLFATAASAADLPSKKYYATPVVEAPLPFYLGINGGYAFANTRNFSSNGVGSAGAVVGYQFNQYFTVEGAYDHLFDSSNYHVAVVTPNYVSRLNNANVTNIYGQINNGTNILALNGLAGYPIGNGFTPYVLAGLGYRWSPVKDEAVYNVGAGIKYSVNRAIDLDLRYRFVNDFNNNQRNNLVTAGFNVKF